MKNKILGILICMLVMSMVPVAAGAAVNQPQTSDIGLTTIQGFIFGLKEINGGNIIEFRCLFVHYVCTGLSQRVTGFRYGGEMMVIPGSYRGVLMPHMIMGWCPGQLEV